MKDLDVGMYVKHKRGAINGCVPPRIARIIERVNNSEFLKLDTDCVILENDVLKASHNIIDLIEVGDYVNGFKIIRRFVNIHNGKKLLIALEKEEGYEYSNNLNDYMGDDSIHIYDEDIKTIVTKEQFESCMYKVGE